MADYVYPSLSRSLMKNTVDLTGKVKAMLVTNKYNPSAKHRTRKDVQNFEVKGAGYTAGGLALTKNRLDDGPNNSTVFYADDLEWTKATITARGVVLFYSSGGGAEYDELICYSDFGSDLSSTNGPFTITWAKDGILASYPDNESQSS